MIRLSKIEYPETIKMILMQDDLWKIVGTKNIHLYKPNFYSNEYYSVSKDNKTIGMFLLQSLGPNTFNFHGGLYRKYRGKNTVLYLKEIISYFKDMYPKSRFVTTVPDTNLVAIRIDRLSGFKYITTKEINKINFLIFEA